MATVGEPLGRSPFAASSSNYNPHIAKSIPILPSSAAASIHSSDPMDTSPNNAPMGPPMMSSPNGERMNEQHGQGEQQQPTTNGGSTQPISAAAAAQQPKVVQTAFIHKLYK